MSAPIKSFLVKQFDSNLRLSSEMGLNVCEESFDYLLDLRLEKNFEMNQVLKKEAVEKIKSIDDSFPYINFIVAESGGGVMYSSDGNLSETWRPRKFEGREYGAMTLLLGGKAARAHVRVFPFWDWRIISFIYEEDYNRPIRMAYMVTYLSSGGVFIVVVVTLLVVFRLFIHRPLSRLVMATKGVSKGDFHKLEDVGGSEFSRLIQSFNVMIDSLESEKAEVRNLIRQLRDSEALFRALFEQAGWSVFVHDEQGRFINVNQHACDELGYTRDELLALSVAEVDPDTELRSDRKAIWTNDDFSARSFEGRHQRKDGGIYNALVNVTAIMYAGRRVFVALVQDVTESKKAQEALRESEKRFRNLLEDMDMVAVQGYDEDRKVTYWNRASERLYGYSREEALGRRLEELIIPEEMHDYVRSSVKNWIERDIKVPSSELELRHKDGSPVPVYSSHVIQENAQGKKELYCIDVDMAEIKKAQAQLIQAKDQAEAANRAKSEFLANMSHEIRTPLNGIIGMLQLLKATSQDPEQKEYTDIAITSSGRLTRLLSDILDLSRIEARKVDIRIEPFAIRDVLNSIRQLFGPAARQKGLDLRLHMDASIPEVLRGDSVRLQQVLSNLVGNAVKFTESGGVLIEASSLPAPDSSHHRVLFSVVDTGPGIPDDKVRMLFKPFTQVTEGYTRQYQGAGLGLAICKNLVELMNGALAVSSEEGVGTTIDCSIPFEVAAPQDAVPWESGQNDALPGKVKVLMAEDDTVSGFAAKRQLENLGCSVLVVENGVEAVKALREGRFDLVLMDIQMPQMDGLEATRAIRSGQAGRNNAGVPIVALTAYAMVGDKDTFINAGMDGYVTKPIDLEALQQAMSRALREGGSRP